MTAAAIARVVEDLRAGRINNITGHDWGELHHVTRDGCPVVDATAIYDSIVSKDEPIYLYEDHPCIAPPWSTGLICYVNAHGNVTAMLTVAFDERDGDGPRWQTDNTVDWDRVRWIVSTVVYIGGRAGDGRPFPTSGPLHLFESAVYDDGKPADLHWTQLVPDYPIDNWENAHLVMLGVHNFMNCRNVQLVEPIRPRAEARCIARTGVTVSTVSVFPTSKSTKGTPGPGAGLGVPLTSVVGHFASYGPKYGRGLLFGKLEGRFWHPQHARGKAELGERRHDYDLIE
jgi:hypothetical protein